MEQRFFLKIIERKSESEDYIYLDNPIHLSCERIFDIGGLKVKSEGPIILGSEVEVELEINSKLPTSIM